MNVSIIIFHPVNQNNNERLMMKENFNEQYVVGVSFYNLMQILIAINIQAFFTFQMLHQ